MADITKFPREHEYVDLKEYEEAVKIYFGVTRLTTTKMYDIWRRKMGISRITVIMRSMID